MRDYDAQTAPRSRGGLTRREVLQASAAAAIGTGLATAPALAATSDGRKHCILINLVGGPGHLDTWDPKPEASSEVRSPFGAIETNVAGIRISELFPRMARQAKHYALVRSVHHSGPAIHDIGHQWLQTGYRFADGLERPHPGAVLAYLQGARTGLEQVVLPTPIGATGGNLSHGQGAGFLGAEWDPLVLNADPSRGALTAADFHFPARDSDERGQRRRALAGGLDLASEAGDSGSAERAEAALVSNSEGFRLEQETEAVRERYGRNKFGQSCLLARRLVEQGTRFVTVNMFETVFNETTWDSHGCAPFSSLEAYRDSVGPWIDQGYSSLLEDLAQRGLLEDTLVVAMGEFGRTPKLNPAGGRDHWTGCWTVLFAGGGVRGGQVVGASDASGAEPMERPVTPPEVTATIYHALGVDPATELPTPEGKALSLLDPGVRPIRELF